MINKIVRKRREILVDLTDLSAALVVLDRFDVCSSRIADFRMGNCGWKKAPTCWFMHFTVSNETWNWILNDFASSGVKLLPETTGH